MNDVILGQVGYGYWGPKLARNWATRPGCNLALVADHDSYRRARASETLPSTRIVEHAEEVMADPALDAVAIATPPATHADLALRALHAGKHVFVEKPLALTVSDAEHVASAAREAGLTLMVGHVLLFHPAVRRLAHLVSSGGLGDVRLIECERTNLGQVRPDISAWWSIAPHDIAVMLFLMGEQPNWISSFGQAYIRPNIEDEVFAGMRFPSGGIGHVHASWISPHRRRRISVTGSKAMAVFDDAEPVDKLRVLDRGVDVAWTQAGAMEVLLRDGAVRSISLEAVEPLAAECDHFIELVRSGGTSLAAADEGVAVVRVLDAGDRSLRRQAPVAITVPGPR